MKSKFFGIVIAILVLMGCGEQRKGTNAEGQETTLNRKDEIRLKKYLVSGRRIYEEKCSNCHQPDGSGLGKLYPPLKSSDYLQQKDIQRITCLIKNGTNDTIQVNGQKYDQAMPGNPDLAPLDLAEIVTFIYNEFGDKTVIITQHDVKKYLEDCGQSSK